MNKTYNILPAIPANTPYIVHFLALSAAFLAPAMSPAKNKLSTLEALTIPAIPSGKQQNKVTKIDSINQFLGGTVYSVGI